MPGDSAEKVKDVLRGPSDAVADEPVFKKAPE
jgi:hypothetical protein